MPLVQIIRFTLCAMLFVVFFDASLGDSRLPLTCKNIARDVIMNSCKGPRIKRSPVESKLEKLIEEAAKAVANDYQQPMRQGKRQLFGSPFGGYETEVMNSHHDINLELPGLVFNNDQGTTMEEQQFGSGFPVAPFGGYPGPYGFTRSMVMPRSVDSVSKSSDPDELLGYTLSSDELEELHKEVSDRLPRNSKDQNKKIFLNVASKCCPNAKLCYENPSLIPCMGY